MRFKCVSWNWGSFMIGYHYGQNPATGSRFLYIGLGPFLGLDFYWPEERYQQTYKFGDEDFSRPVTGEPTIGKRTKY